jgi:hypothetical protein
MGKMLRIAGMSLSGLMVNRGRSALSMLGIVIGVFAVILLTSLGWVVLSPGVETLRTIGGADAPPRLFRQLLYAILASSEDHGTWDPASSLGSRISMCRTSPSRML